MIRILHIMGDMSMGGAETHIMKIYREINREVIQFDFLLNVQDRRYYEDEIELLGGRIFRETPKTKNLLKNFLDTYKIVKKNKYKIVLKCSEHSLSWTDMLAAKIGGASIRIMRSTNSKASSSKLSSLLHYLSRPILNNLTTLKIAPSKIAGEWLFGKHAVNDLVIIKNGIPMDRFSYNSNIRNKIREELGLSSKYIIGHVGRFETQKNHFYLLDIFKSVLDYNENAVLILLGEGQLQSSIKFYVNELGISRKVFFLGVISDVEDLMMAMDVLVLPSLYEGLPNCVIEAQALGLECIISDTITKEVGISDLVTFLPLVENNKIWVDEILKHANGYERKEINSLLLKEGYDIKQVARWFEEYYISHCS